MLSQETINTVKSTAPLLAKEGENITRLFYRKLFDNHPELKNVFNMANQAKGEQARALAESVFAYANHIDQLDALGPVVSRIAHKHASLQVAPEHYPIVGKFLLEAIKDHLKIDAEDPVLQAWAEAYQVLADIFISTEEDIYQSNADKLGGWRGFRRFVISDIVQETPDIKSYSLQPEDGAPIAGFLPGQYIGVKAHSNTSEFEEIRQYSLSNSPGEKYYRITVKAESSNSPQPGIVSNYLHNASVGEEVLLQPPTGDFVVRSPNKDLLLIGGGIGITPLLSILLDQIERGHDMNNTTFIHCCQDKDHHVMGEKLRKLSEKSGFRYIVAYERGEEANHIGYLNSSVLGRWLGPTNHDVYFCGPTPFMTALHILLSRLGYTEEQLHYEVFGPSIQLN